MKIGRNVGISVILGFFIALGALAYWFYGESFFKPEIYSLEGSGIMIAPNVLEPEEEKVIHLPTPDPVRAVYMTSWVAGERSLRSGIVSLIESSELNAVVIDVKDFSGKISFEVSDEKLKVASEERIPDIKDFIKYLHGKNIYVIARISVFQDLYYSGAHPELAVKKLNGAVWKDKKGLSWIDPVAREYWDYTVLVSKEAERVGFDELNFDYVRFPSDGNMRDIAYDHWDEVTPRIEVMGDFFAYLSDELSGLNLPLSVDLFGMVTTNTDDLNIGQLLETADLYFDYISPMVYPSHYPVTFIGLANPAANPYEVVHYSLSKASERLLSASSSPQKLRPWLQDFDLGVDYDAGMVNKQKQAGYDLGINSWMMWNAANKYTKEAY